MLRMYARTHSPIDSYNILAVEQEFNIDVDGFVLNGFIDRVDKVGDDAICIIDYKSSRSIFSRDDLATDLQFSIYGLAARTLYPWAKRVTFEFHMLRFDIAQRTERSTQQIDDTRGYVVSLGRQTETDTVWEARLNNNCGYCDHRHRCDAYATALQGKSEITKVIDPSDLTQVVKERAEVARLAKMMYSRKEELDRILKAKLKEEGEYAVGGYNVRYINSFDRSYPVGRTIQIFERMGVPRAEIEQHLLTIDKDAVNNLRIHVTENLDRGQAMLLKTELEAIEEKTPGTPRLDVHAIKGK
jgi:putative RecB family exonuclease